MKVYLMPWVDQDKCTFCGKCFSACLQEAVRSNSENPLLMGGTPRSPGDKGFGRDIGRGLRKRR